MASFKLNPIWEFLKGYKVDTVSCVPSNLICMLCNSILINARQTPCGCRYCFECITEQFRVNRKVCPGKTEDCSNDELDITRDVICDNNANREICRLIVKCPHILCPEESELRRMPDHIAVCDYGEKVCEKCNQIIMKKDVALHSLRECELRIIACEFCNDSFTSRDIETMHHNVQHERLCGQYRSPCPNNCGTGGNVLLKAHLIVCKNKPQPCPYVPIGCALVHISRHQMDEHLHSETLSHTKSLLQYIDNLNNEITTLKLANVAQSNIIESLRATTNLHDRSFEKKHNDFLWPVSHFTATLQAAIDGKRRYIDSKPFLSDRYGYKMKLRLHPNGDGDGVGSHLSLYFLILEGKYDDVLPWPFAGTVTMALVNCTGQEDHVRVCNYKNLRQGNEHGGDRGAGCSKFFEIAQLSQRGFLKNDNIYIKCTIN